MAVGLIGGTMWLLAEKRYETAILSDNVATLRMAYEEQLYGDHALSSPERPYLVLPSYVHDATTQGLDGSDPENRVEISFDEMSHGVHLYSYYVLHLNTDHTVSELFPSEYMRGMPMVEIVDYEHSMNTQRLYTHYRFSFPNEDMVLTRTGDYVVCICEDNDADKLVATQIVRVTSAGADIRVDVRSDTYKELHGRYQQLDIDVVPPLQRQSSTTNLAGDYFIIVEQNGRTDNRVVRPKPNFVESNRLRFVNNKDLLFEGGCEYRHMDTYSTYFAGAGVERVWYENGDYQALLPMATAAQYGPYVHEFDANGQRVVNSEKTDEDDTESEYMWVYFALAVDQPWLDGQVFVGGDVFENRLTARNRMWYDEKQHCYFLASLIKQGGVDYQYWFLGKGQQAASVLRTEGSHYETRNEYTILVYYHPFGSRVDELVGMQRVYGQ